MGGSQNRGGYPPRGGQNEQQDTEVRRIREAISKLPSFDLYQPADMVKDALKLSQVISDDLKNTQLRRLYGMVKRIESIRRASKAAERDQETRDQLELLRPRLFYAAGRQPGVRPVRDIMDEAITSVNKQQKPENYQKAFQRFIDFFEALVAYSTKR